MLTPPARRRGTELLDDPKTSDDDRERAMQDLARSNRLFRGTASVVRVLRHVWSTLPERATLLDVGTGMGDIPAAVAADARRRGVSLTTVGVDSVPYQATLARRRVTQVVAGDARALPFADGSADVVTCSQVLHHFFDDDLRALIAELDRVSRDWIVVSELRRNRLAAIGFRLAGRIFGFHPITRVDGIASIYRGFTAAELDRLVTDVTGVRPVVRQGIFWRLTATWRKRSARARS